VLLRIQKDGICWFHSTWELSAMCWTLTKLTELYLSDVAEAFRHWERDEGDGDNGSGSRQSLCITRRCCARRRTRCAACSSGSTACWRTRYWSCYLQLVLKERCACTLWCCCFSRAHAAGM
jgi:hypothetical protein